MSSPKPPESLQLAINRDARLRAVRAFAWGLLIDIAVAVTLVMVTAVTAIEWTSVYWLALAGTLGKSVIQAVVTYFARKLLPPKLG